MFKVFGARGEMPRVDEESALLGGRDAGVERRRVGTSTIRYALAGSAALSFALVAILTFGGEVREYKSQESEPESAPVLQGAQESDKPLPPSPFVAMQGMFAYETWTESEIKRQGDPDDDARPLLQSMPNFGASVESWETIRAAVQTGLGATGQRKLFIFLRHAQAMHNQWGLHAHETKFVNDIPCDYKGKGNLVDPDLTGFGRLNARTFVRDVLESGLGKEIGGEARVFSSPLSRTLETTEIGFGNQTVLKIKDGRVTVSELLRERIDTRVPFEVRRPVSYMKGVDQQNLDELFRFDDVDPSKLQNGDTVGSVTVDFDGDKGIMEHSAKQLWEGEQKVLNTKQHATLGASEPRANPTTNTMTKSKAGQTADTSELMAPQCFVPSRGLGLAVSKRGWCCVENGLKQKFGPDNLFDFNVTIPNKDLSEAERSARDKTNEAYVCKLMEAGRLGNELCYGPAMLGLLAHDDVNLTPGREEGESELVGRVRTWIASVFDEVEDRVIVAVTHSDWIKLAMHDLGVDKSWLVPRNSEMLPVIVEDTRPKPKVKH